MAVNLEPPRAEDLLTISGVRLGVARAGVRKPNRKDLLVVALDEGSRVAGVFTRNRFRAAPVLVCKEHLNGELPIRALVVNTGVANAGTGDSGLRNARAVCAAVAQHLDIEPTQVLPMSTGVIMEPLPVDRIEKGLPDCIEDLAPGHWVSAAEAIMTTDTVSKEAAVSRGGFTVGGMAKGSGMIHPDLATMLAIVTTDYPLAPGEPIEFLRPAVDESFNSISVDGDCSTNDAVVLLANGASAIERTPATDLAFAAALRKTCRELAEQIVADGEGVTVLAEITVTGAADDGQAKAIARRIATSALVKTALFGRDANWGRVLMAAGSAPYNGGYAEVDVDRMTLSYNGSVVLERGAPMGVEPDVSGTTCTIGLDLGIGTGTASYLTSDLSYDYVRINADYRT